MVRKKIDTRFSKSRFIGRRNGVAIAVVVLVAIGGYHFLYHSSAASFMCESYGNYCVGSADLNIGSLVSERNPGRSIAFYGDGGSWFGNPTGHLAFTAANDRCLQATSFGVVVGHCSNTPGISWARVPSPGGHKFHNQYFGLYLASHNCGCQYQLKSPGVSGWLYQFQGPF